MKRWQRAQPFRGLRWVTCGVLAALLSGCTPPEETLGASITGYNHTYDQSIYYYTVNGNMGAGMSAQRGGGGYSCCVAIPKYWRPGIKVKVWWDYQGGTRIPPEPPPHVAEVELPPYKPADIGAVQVHFYPEQKIRVVVSSLSMRSPDFPAELRFGAPAPLDAIAGRALPFPPEENPEQDVVRPGETFEQSQVRVEGGLRRAAARRQAKQARWDALVARKAAGLPVDEASLPKLLPPEPMPALEPGSTRGEQALPDAPLPSSTSGGAR